FIFSNFQLQVLLNETLDAGSSGATAVLAGQTPQERLRSRLFPPPGHNTPTITGAKSSNFETGMRVDSHWPDNSAPGQSRLEMFRDSFVARQADKCFGNFVFKERSDEPEKLLARWSEREGLQMACKRVR